MNLVNPCSAQSLSNDHPIVNLQNQGYIQGYYDHNLAIFKGIAYASPPTGKNRWLPPQPVNSWTNIKLTTQFSADCSQEPNPWNNTQSSPTSEDCLYLNIWAPKETFNQPDIQHRYPVIVWIHGGGFVMGGSSVPIYDGSQIAQQGVILVSFNYRLGRLGFFAHPALKEENEEYPWINYGLMDQIAALRWVKKNIIAFGGDTNNITLLGESAGGASILSLMTISEATDLFNKVIIQSGTGRLNALQPTSLEDAQKASLNFAKLHHIYGQDANALEQLRNLPSQDITKDLNIKNIQTDYFSSLTIDGLLLQHSIKEAFKKGLYFPKPMLIGDNDGDGLFFSIPSLAELTKQLNSNENEINKIYNSTGKKTEKSIIFKLLADIQILEPTRILAMEVSSKNVPVYRYRFSYILDNARSYTTYGAPHASELPFIFNNLNKQFKIVTAQDKAMADAMMTSWINFAKMGNPSIPNFFEFKSIHEAPNKLLHFSLHGINYEKDPATLRLNFIEKQIDY